MRIRRAGWAALIGTVGLAVGGTTLVLMTGDKKVGNAPVSSIPYSGTPQAEALLTAIEALENCLPELPMQSEPGSTLPGNEDLADLLDTKFLSGKVHEICYPIGSGANLDGVHRNGEIGIRLRDFGGRSQPTALIAATLQHEGIHMVRAQQAGKERDPKTDEAQNPGGKHDAEKEHGRLNAQGAMALCATAGQPCDLNGDGTVESDEELDVPCSVIRALLKKAEQHYQNAGLDGQQASEEVETESGITAPDGKKHSDMTDEELSEAGCGCSPDEEE